MKHFIITLDYKSLSDNENMNQRIIQYEKNALDYFHERFVCVPEITYNYRTKYHRIKVDFPRYVPLVVLSYLPVKLSKILMSNRIPLKVIKSIKIF